MTIPPKLKAVLERLDPAGRELVTRYAESMAEENRLREALASGRPTAKERRRIEAAIADAQAWRAAAGRGERG